LVYILYFVLFHEKLFAHFIVHRVAVSAIVAVTFILPLTLVNKFSDLDHLADLVAVEEEEEEEEEDMILFLVDHHGGVGWVRYVVFLVLVTFLYPNSNLLSNSAEPGCQLCVEHRYCVKRI
jgi:hypothetical protein